MSRDQTLQLFTAFHANLDFSAIPSVDLARVVERCYWPILDLRDRLDLPLGIEFPARTLALLNEVDPEWVKALRTRCESHRIEVIGSGLAQVVGPLVPSDVNRQNAIEGAAAYRRILGWVPETWFVNEQTFSRGLVSHYGAAGAKRLVMEWNNPASTQRALRGLRTTAARLAGETGDALDLLWNDSIVFQRVQQCVHGSRPLRDLSLLIDSIAERWGAGALCLYGGDLEVFDYRPGSAPEATGDREMERLEALFRGLRERHPFVLPHQVNGAPGPLVDLCCAADPMPCKKQPRYNPTRWALSGRNAMGMNTRCFALRRSQRCAEALGASRASRELVDLWRSDFRTRATEEKVEAFSESMGAARERARARLEAAMPALPERADLLLVNPWERAWPTTPVEIDLELPSGRGAGRVEVVGAAGASLGDHQIEACEFYRDGSLRRAILVADVALEGRGSLALRIAPAPRTRGASAAPAEAHEIETATVRARFLPSRGGALESLSFPRLDPRARAGTRGHGSFLDMAFTPDFYSGHVVAFGEDGQKVTDLVPATPEWGSRGPLRSELRFRVRTEFGDWLKRWRVYHQIPRIDLVHELRFPALRLASLRLGTITLRNEAWNRDTMALSTVQGGPDVERFPLPTGIRLDQGRAVSPSVSATGCFGATEGWLAIEDERGGILALGDRAQGAALPMVQVADVDDSFFARIEHSAAERDENRATFVRGVKRFPFAWIGFTGDAAGAIDTARRVERGLALRTARGCGVVRCL